MLIFESSSHLFGISNDAYTLLSQILIGCSLLQADWFITNNNEKATLHINVPYYFNMRGNFVGV